MRVTNTTLTRRSYRVPCRSKCRVAGCTLPRWSLTQIYCGLYEHRSTRFAVEPTTIHIRALDRKRAETGFDIRERQVVRMRYSFRASESMYGIEDKLKPKGFPVLFEPRLCYPQAMFQVVDVKVYWVLELLRETWVREYLEPKRINETPCLRGIEGPTFCIDGPSYVQSSLCLAHSSHTDSPLPGENLDMKGA
jgi:hypothetical protein